MLKKEMPLRKDSLKKINKEKIIKQSTTIVKELLSQKNKKLDFYPNSVNNPEENSSIKLFNKKSPTSKID